MLHGVIMSGGSGTRFWPLSRTARPKQFLQFGGDRTLLQGTADRCEPLIPGERMWVVTNARQADETRRQLDRIPPEQVLVEPQGRNTAPCVGLAAVHLLRRDPEAVMVLMPADHAITPADSFRQGLAAAAGLVEADPQRLVLFGVRPTYAATGFGYIERGESLPPPGAFHVASFREKPNHDTAEEYLQSGRYFWNCGIFVWRAQTILDRLSEFEPEMHAGLMRIAAAIGTARSEPVLADEFPQLKSTSIDYAVLERAEHVCVLQARFDWDDVGSWEALARLEGADPAGNTLIGPVCAVDVRGCVVRSQPGHLVAAIDVDDLLIVHTPDATLVARRGDEQAMRRIIQTLKDRGLDHLL